MDDSIAAWTGEAALGTSNSPRANGSVRGAAVGARVAEERKRVGLTGTAFGARIGLSKDQVSKVESGARRLNVSELAMAASVLGVTVDSLLGTPQRPHLAIAARLASGAGSEDVRAGHRRARQLLEIADLLTRTADLPSPAMTGEAAHVMAVARALPPPTRRQAVTHGEQIANLLRETLKLGHAPLADVADLCERNFGVDVAISALGTGLSGLCIHADGVALLLASGDFPSGHVRFTLVHELAHHLFGDPSEVIDDLSVDMFGDTPLERRCNAFAGHLLMPRAGLTEVLTWLGDNPGTVADRSVIYLMGHYGVSLAALVYQLNVIGWLSFEHGQEMKARGLKALSGRVLGSAPIDVPGIALPVVPQRLARTAHLAVRSQRLGLGVLAALFERDDDDALWAEVMGDDDPDGNDIDIGIYTE